LTEQARKGRQALDDLAATTQRALARVTADRDGVLAALDAKVANNGRVLADRDRILAAVEEARVADAAIETAAASRQAAVAAQTRAHAAVTEATATLGVVRAEAQHAARLRQDAALLDTVPCGGAAPYTGCAFLQQAIVARQTIAAWPDRAAAVARATETLAAAQATAQEAASQLQDAEATAQAAGRERQALTATVALVPRLEAAEARLAELAQERRDLLTATAATAVRVQQEADDRRAGLEQDLVALGTELAQVDLTAAQVQVAALADQVALADAVGGELAVARQTREAAATTVARLEAEQQALDARQAAYSARCAERARVETWSTTLDTWLLEWQWLAKALGRDGLPVLEIDAAGPTVSSVANDLLHACFDGRFTLDLVTQEAKTSGKGLKETFELKVFDNARGGEARDLADLSGGEQIVVDEALKGALAIVLNQRMGTPLQTVFRDETTAPLDGDNALRYVQMLRRMCTLGGFTRIYYVSHNRDASAQADAQIVVHDGTADVRLPPYPAAA
jgi:exonuclease SbcC